eukprot:TRINITY_DN7173_c0_g1_i6.p1 TRINITY_DN7173_c0_g1~~TRINITY_DN7173_c0_g1_i6.p1  ORF type:complete len:118 (+),score=14.53 TRINITY_DN7173_c0_g1_i6:162-515(+)
MKNYKQCLELCSPQKNNMPLPQQPIQHQVTILHHPVGQELLGLVREHQTVQEEVARLKRTWPCFAQIRTSSSMARSKDANRPLEVNKKYLLMLKQSIITDAKAERTCYEKSEDNSCK